MVEPVLVAIAAALAGKSVGNLYDLVRGRFAGTGRLGALEAVGEAGVDSPEVGVLAEALAESVADDAEFGEELRRVWADRPTVHNEISGDVHGRVIQAGEIHGNITFSG
jgi:hypothetical protein